MLIKSKKLVFKLKNVDWSKYVFKMRLATDRTFNIQQLINNIKYFLLCVRTENVDQAQIVKLTPLIIDRLEKQDFKMLSVFFERLRMFNYSESCYRSLYAACCLVYELLNESQLKPLWTSIDNSLVQLNPEGHVILTMTSCKRFDLLQRTIRSMVMCITDLNKYVREWVVVDDNSSEEDRALMKTTFPFIRYVMKNDQNKGHPKSMNMIRELVLQTKAPYHLHIEDDFEFFVKKPYIQQMIEVVDSKEEYGQCLVNLEYGEDPFTAHKMWGQPMFYTSKGTRYFEHAFYEGDELRKKNESADCMQCWYWPHYSFRVGITKTKVYKTVGAYDEKAEHFEREYAYRYVAKKFKTTFLDGCYCTHIGRRTYERNSDLLNAYDLNDEHQFGEGPKKNVHPEANKLQKQQNGETPQGQQQVQQQPQHLISQSSPNDINIQMWLINLERRQDRLIDFVKTNHNNCPPFQVFTAVDGKAIEPNSKVQRIFQTNDYNYRSGIVGCAYSHIKIWKEMLNLKEYEYGLVVEDDAKFGKNFMEKLVHLIGTYRGQFEVMFLQHHPWAHARRAEDYLEHTIPTAEIWTRDECIQRTMGGTTAYLITKDGAANLLEHIARRGVENGIDWVMFKHASPTKDAPPSRYYNRIMYCTPFICHADCLQSNPNADSDIQADYHTVGFKTPSDWNLHELKYWQKKLDCTTLALVGSPALLLPNAVTGIQRKAFLWLTDKMTQEGKIVQFIPKSSAQFNIDTDVNTFTHRWYQTYDMYIVLPHCFITESVLADKVFGHEYMNLATI